MNCGSGVRGPLLYRMMMALSVSALAGCGAGEPGTAGRLGPAKPTGEARRYWDGAVATVPTVGPGGCEAWKTEVMALRRPDPLGSGQMVSEYGRPELMAVGDSLFNGVQSLRINWWLSEWSAPNLVAIRLGLIQERGAERTGQRAFYSPQYLSHGAPPRETIDYGFNLEAIPRFIGLAAAPHRQGDALRKLLGTPPANGRLLVDNLAFLGANSYDLLNWTPADYRDAVGRLPRLLEHLGLGGFATLADALFYSNAAFVLNPTRHPCLEGMTAIEQVEWRRPRRLLVSIGANDGMYGLAFSGDRLGSPACSTSGERGRRGLPRCSAETVERALTEDYVGNVRAILSRLSKVAGLENVYLNALPQPSRTANLVPYKRGDWFWYNDLLSAPGQDETDVSRKVSLTRGEMEAADGLIRTVNGLVRAEVAAANAAAGGMGRAVRFTTVDVDARLGRYDAKGCDLKPLPEAERARCKQAASLAIPPARFGGGADARFDNRPIRFESETGLRDGVGLRDAAGSRITQGGLFSFDNMHLSSVGYEIMADEIVSAMRRNPREHGLLPAKVGSCPNKGQARWATPFGACAALMTTPGWSYHDPGARERSFLRVAGLKETNDLDTLHARLNFLHRLTYAGASAPALPGGEHRPE